MFRGGFVMSVMLGSFLASPAIAANAATTPDFTGRWGRNAFNIEPMPSGPQPVANLTRLPDGTSNISQLVGDYRNPILKPEIAEIVKQKGEISLSGQAFPDPSNQCRPYNPPFTHAMQLGVEILQKKDSVTLLYDQDVQVRHIRLNAAHPANVKPTPMGDSVGHYEGDTLVVDTVAIRPGPYALVDRYGTPVTEGLHVVERFRLIDGVAAKEAQDRYEKREGRLGGAAGVRPVNPDTSLKGLQVQVTVEDPNVFTTPWSGYVTYRRKIPTLLWEEQICADNPNEYYAGGWVGLPKADKPDF
jgi:hypothetical protein